MFPNLQRNFRYYLALLLALLLGFGVRLQAAPLGGAPVASPYAAPGASAHARA